MIDLGVKRIQVNLFGDEIGKLQFDYKKNASYFQYKNVEELMHKYPNCIPSYIVKKTNQVQYFTSFQQETFRNIPPVFADSLPDSFGNEIFMNWLQYQRIPLDQISPIIQLAYIGNRGMGALEYEPILEDIRSKPGTQIDIPSITSVIQQMLKDKKKRIHDFKMEEMLQVYYTSSAIGGARPKILVSRDTSINKMYAGDILEEKEVDHLIIKLRLPHSSPYPSLLEYTYYQMAQKAAIPMMNSFMIKDAHFATHRYDRIGNQKQHVLTATGLTGWDFRDKTVSSYDNLFKLAIHLQLSTKDMQHLYKRMVFNIISRNTDDHLKNHSFKYDTKFKKWTITPSYDLTYPVDPEFSYQNIPHALSMNGISVGHTYQEVLQFGIQQGIHNPKRCIEECLEACANFIQLGLSNEIPKSFLLNIEKKYNFLKH